MTGRNQPLRRILRNPGGLIGLALLGLVGAMALCAGLFFPDDPLGMVAPSYLWPGQDPAFPLGTDNLGRDVAAGIFHGSRVSLAIGFVAAAICIGIGTVVGAVGGYFDGRVDRWLTRLTEAVQTVPSFLFLIVLVAVFSSSIATITIGIGAVSWPTVARLMRSEFRSLRAREFVLAAKAYGSPPWRIILREILPNALPPLIVTTSVVVATAILNESALAFVGLGDPNTLSWGMMIGNGRSVIRTAWYLTAIPGCFIVMTVLGVNLVGEALNDALRPTTD